MKARDIMTTALEVVTGEEPVSLAAELMRAEDVGVIPVVWSRGDMRLRGLLTDRDIAIRHVAPGHGADCRVSDDMTIEPLVTVAPDTDVADVMRLMERKQVRRVPVTDDAGRLLGLIAQADIATKTGSDQAADVAHVVEGISRTPEPR